MTKDELFKDPLFLRLPEALQKFVRELVENGKDKVAAAHMTWKCKDDLSASSMANRAMRKLAVRKLVDSYFGIDVRDMIPTREEVAAEAWRRFCKETDGATALKWLAIFNQTMGYNTRPSDTPQPP